MDTMDMEVEEDPVKPISTYFKEIRTLAEKCLLPKLEVVAEEITNWEEVIPFGSKQTLGTKLDEIITVLKSPELLARCQEEEIKRRDRVGLVPAIVLVGEHRFLDRPWTSERLVKKCDEIGKGTLAVIGGGSNEVRGDQLFAEVFSKDIQEIGLGRKSIFYGCLQNVREKLRSGNWKYYPGAVSSFSWIVTQVKYPNLSEFVGDVLAPCLLLLDDYNEENKIMGIALAGYGIANFNKADLVKDNWALVLYNAFLGLLYDKNPKVIEGVMPLLISVLKIIEVNPNDHSHNFTKYDETMRKMLFALDTCTERSLKYSWIVQITSFLEIMGHATLHWNNKLCDSMIHFTATNDAELWKAILKCLQAQIRNTWLKPNSNKIAEIVLRLVLNCSVLDFPNISQEERNEIIELCRDTFKLLEKCSDFETVRAELDMMKQNKEFHKDFLKTLKSF